MINNKKGISVWVSAVLYFGIGIVIISLILSAAMPVVNRIRDKNVATQTKNVFFELDKSIKQVAKEGGGAQRMMTADLKKGVLDIDKDKDIISWNFTTKAIMSEPGVDVKEGMITIRTTKSDVEGEYLLSYTMDYSCSLDISSSLNTLTGVTELGILNEGVTVDKKSNPQFFVGCNLDDDTKITQIRIKEKE